MKDFWISSGHHLLDRDARGLLVVTDEFFKAYFARPELMPPQQACDNERSLHRRLLANPRLLVGADEVSAIADADARENWRFVLALRNLLLRHATLEAAYLSLIRSGSIDLPPLFINQLVHVILRNALSGCEDPFVLRAGELFFRSQRVMPHAQALLLGDEEIVGAGNQTPVLSLMAMQGAASDAQIDVLSEENADSYWRRSDQFDMGLDLTRGRRGEAALANVMTRWVSHLLGIEVAIEPLPELRNARLAWYVGLDSEATRIGDGLWHGDELDDLTSGRVLALFRLAITDTSVVAHALEGEPIHLILAMTSLQIVKMKPQNLLTGLPIKHLEVTA